jgi:Coenzyme PQQ synthesis protein D (PqqD)
MKLFSKKTVPNKQDTGLTRTEALAAIPRRLPSATWRILADRDILIEYPLNIKPFFLQLANRFSGRQEQRFTKKLQLDAMGSSVWRMFDGKRDVTTIILQVAEQSGLTLQEAEISVTTFVRELGRRGLVLLR